MEHMEPKPIALEAHGAATEAEPGDRTMTTHVTFATRSPGPLQDLTLRRPGLAIDAYPLGGLLLLRCVGNASGIESSPELQDSGRKILYQARSGEELTLLLDGGQDEEETIASLAEQNAHVVSPIRWQRGEAHITLVLEDGTDPRAHPAPAVRRNGHRCFQTGRRSSRRWRRPAGTARPSRIPRGCGGPTAPRRPPGVRPWYSAGAYAPTGRRREEALPPRSEPGA